MLNIKNKKANVMESPLSFLRKRTIQNLCATEAGKLFFHFMMLDCGFHENNLIMNGPEVNKEAMIVNEALRRYYLGVRKLIPREALKEIEFLELEHYIKKEEKVNE